jgi:hypothetical protein
MFKKCKNNLNVRSIFLLRFINKIVLIGNDKNASFQEAFFYD